ncbi:MAG: hypothetical protein HUJ62_06485 [Streptococcus gallolyticus]|nr:hypothetical protein [Streptococcus gallolyticus]
MNNMDTKVDKRGVVLTDNVDKAWLKSLEPQYYADYIKFVVNPKTNKVCVGMDIHAYCQQEMGPAEDLLGGNIYFDEDKIIYTSTLNVPRNLKLPGFKGNPRIIADEDGINIVNNVLKAWVNL